MNQIIIHVASLLAKQIDAYCIKQNSNYPKGI